MSSVICYITDQCRVRTMSLVSSGFAILQTFVERGVYSRQLGVTAPSSIKFVSSQRMGDVEVPRIQCVVRKCARSLASGALLSLDQSSSVSVVRHCILAVIVLMDAVTMVVTCCPFDVFSSCVSFRKRSLLCGRSWSVLVRVFTSMSNTLGLVVVFVVLLLAQAL